MVSHQELSQRLVKCRSVDDASCTLSSQTPLAERGPRQAGNSNTGGEPVQVTCQRLASMAQTLLISPQPALCISGMVWTQVHPRLVVSTSLITWPRYTETLTKIKGIPRASVSVQALSGTPDTESVLSSTVSPLKYSNMVFDRLGRCPDCSPLSTYGL
jgi:hypothetical protein